MKDNNMKQDFRVEMDNDFRRDRVVNLLWDLREVELILESIKDSRFENINQVLKSIDDAANNVYKFLNLNKSLNIKDNNFKEWDELKTQLEFIFEFQKDITK